jgi:hypothetical protein
VAKTLIVGPPLALIFCVGITLWGISEATGFLSDKLRDLYDSIAGRPDVDGTNISL